MFVASRLEWNKCAVEVEDLILLEIEDMLRFSFSRSKMERHFCLYNVGETESTHPLKKLSFFYFGDSLMWRSV